MNKDLKKQLLHVLWIGGATDAGKSTIAQRLAERHGLYVYHYDKMDAQHHIQLAATIPEIRKFNNASLEERWLIPEPEALFEHALFSFSCRFPLVIEDLLALPSDKPVIVEGFGILPELLHPLLSSPYQAIWLVPTSQFKEESMARRGKPSFARLISDPEKAKRNLFARDMMLADYYRGQVPAYGYTLHEVDGSSSIEDMVTLVDDHFAKYLECLR